MNNRIGRYAAIICCLIARLGVSGQEISVQAPNKVYVGDNFTVRFVVNDNVNDFRGPTFSGFNASGPATSRARNISFINGQKTESTVNTFTYSLAATEEGEHTIGPAMCKAGGKTISSKSFTIIVEKFDQNSQQHTASPQQSSSGAQTSTQSQGQPGAGSLFARASVSNTNPWQGEQVIITYKVYTQIELRQFGIDKLPGNKGFWAEDLSSGNQQVKHYEETIDGRRYVVYEIRRGALFAQQSGQLEIEPLNLNVLAIVQGQRRRGGGGFFEDFFDDFFTTMQPKEIALQTNRIGVNVRPLPKAPDSYYGGVGKFEVSGGANLKDVKTNEALTYRITVSGSGNLMLMDVPRPEFPSSFEVYDPQITDNIKKSDAGVSGSRTYEWILIPRTKGAYTIPEFKYTYFDPSSGTYSTRTIDRQDVDVARGAAGSAAYSGKDDVQIIAEDINYIHPITKLGDSSRKPINLWFWLVALAIVAATAVALVFGKKQQAARQDVAGMRMRKATKKAQKRLKRAAAYLGDGNSNLFYEEIYKAIWGCLSDKYSIPLSNLNRENVAEHLSARNIDAAQQERIMNVLQDVDIARFAPGDPSSQKQKIYTEALIMIASL